MVSTFKLLAALAVVCIAILGLLLAFGGITIETVTGNSIQILGGVAVLFFAAFALKAIAGRGPGGQSDPPPTL